MDYFLQQLVNGLTLGSIYGLIAIGYTMVYGIIGMINFAHGDIFMVGSFMALIGIVILGITAATPFLILVAALIAVLLAAMVLTSFWGWTASPTGRSAARSAWRRSSPRSACRSCCRTSSRSSRGRG